MITKIHKSSGMYETSYEEKTAKLLERLGKKSRGLSYQDVNKIEDKIFTEQITDNYQVDKAIKDMRFKK